MTIDKAIEILETHQCDMPRDKVPDLIDAIRLGIEALNIVKQLKNWKIVFGDQKLPSETED